MLQKLSNFQAPKQMEMTSRHWLPQCPGDVFCPIVQRTHESMNNRNNKKSLYYVDKYSLLYLCAESLCTVYSTHCFHHNPTVITPPATAVLIRYLDLIMNSSSRSLIFTHPDYPMYPCVCKVHTYIIMCILINIYIHM